jgi:nicotinamidase-related amidase
MRKYAFTHCVNVMAEPLSMDKSKTALVVIDLQKGVSQMETKPHSAKDVITNAAKLADAFRRSSMPVFLVRVSMGPGTMLKTISDESFQRPANMAPDWADFVTEMTPRASDITITKRQWGAFYGTELELALRRMGIDTIVLCGIATDYGVESTARFAYEFGFQQIFAEDAMSSRSEEQHNAAVNFVLKRIGRVRKTEEILRAL